VLSVPRKSQDTSTFPDVEGLQSSLQNLLARIDMAGESVIAVQAIEAGWGATYSNDQYQGWTKTGSAYGAGLGYSYTAALVVITKTP
jgi:hypothetical protein